MKSWTQRARSEWRRFLKSRPGHRFQDLHERRKNQRGSDHAGRGKVLMIAGVVIALIGIVLLPLPGPGMIVVAGGLMLLASESLTVARVLDKADKLRAELMTKIKEHRGKGRKRADELDPR